MKYMIMLFGDESGWSDNSTTSEEFEASMQRHEDFDSWCAANDISVSSGEELELSPSAITIYADGKETDGPFLELKEQLGGFYVIETDSLELAREAARRCPNYGANELRPVPVRE